MAAYNACKKTVGQIAAIRFTDKTLNAKLGDRFCNSCIWRRFKNKRCGRVLFYLLRFTSFDRVAFFVDLL